MGNEPEETGKGGIIEIKNQERGQYRNKDQERGQYRNQELGKRAVEKTRTKREGGIETKSQERAV